MSNADPPPTDPARPAGPSPQFLAGVHAQSGYQPMPYVPPVPTGPPVPVAPLGPYVPGGPGALPLYPPPGPDAARAVASRTRVHPVAAILIVLLGLVQLGVLALPFTLPWALPALRRTAVPTTTTSGGGSTAGSPGLGDPYFPDAGNGGYDVTKYQISVRWDAANQTLSGTTVISARATQQLESFYYDLALTTESVSVDGRPVRSFDRHGFADVEVQPDRPIAAGSAFQVSVTYSGRPGDLRQGDVAPWWTTGEEWTAAGEPEVAAWWFPSNDHPSDPALMDTTIRVPHGMQAISTGRLESFDPGSDGADDTWHWIARQPMATFLNFVSIGHYELKQGVDQGIPYVYAVSEQLSPSQRKTAFDALLTSRARVSVLEAMFGPYPFSELGGVVPAHKLWFGGLENQTRPVYNAGSILNRGFAPELITHELAHMWFGDNVTVKQWNDIFDSEGYASWAQWGYNERTGGQTATQAMNQMFDRYAGERDFWQITMVDPGKENLFDTVYERGPMLLQGLRNVIGDDAFFRLARDWSQDPGSRSLEEWMAAAQAHTTVDLGPFFQAWIYSPTAPARTAANGFR